MLRQPDRDRKQAGRQQAGRENENGKQVGRMGHFAGGGPDAQPPVEARQVQAGLMERADGRRVFRRASLVNHLLPLQDGDAVRRQHAGVKDFGKQSLQIENAGDGAGDFVLPGDGQNDQDVISRQAFAGRANRTRRGPGAAGGQQRPDPAHVRARAVGGDAAGGTRDPPLRGPGRIQPEQRAVIGVMGDVERGVGQPLGMHRLFADFPAPGHAMQRIDRGLQLRLDDLAGAGETCLDHLFAYGCLALLDGEPHQQGREYPGDAHEDG